MSDKIEREKKSILNSAYQRIEFLKSLFYCLVVFLTGLLSQTDYRLKYPVVRIGLQPGTI